MSSRLESIDAHRAFFLLRNCISMLRLPIKHSNSPCYRLHSELTEFDETLRQAASTICNVNFDDTGWQQSTFPVAQCGLGLSSAVNASLPAYASSHSANRQLVGQILQDVCVSCPTSEVDSISERWTELGHELIATDKKSFQRYWSSAVHEALFRSLKAGAPPSRLARQLPKVTRATQSLRLGPDWTTKPFGSVLLIGSPSMSALHTSVDVGLLSNQTAFIHFHAISVLIDFRDTARTTS